MKQIFETFQILMKLLSQLLLSLKSIFPSFINSVSVLGVITITGLILITESYNNHHGLTSLFHFTTITLTTYLIIIMILKIKTFLTESLNNYLDNSEVITNSKTSNKRIVGLTLPIDQADRNKSIEENTTLKQTKLSILQDILYVTIYNLLNISIIKIITILWSFISFETVTILTSDPTILESTGEEVLLSIIPNLFFFRRLTKISYIHSDDKKILSILDELFDIKEERIKRRIIKNTKIILHQIFIYCNKLQPIKPHLLDRIHKTTPIWDMHRLMHELFRNWTSNKYKYLKSNIENKNLRYYVLTEIILTYWDLIIEKIDREELARTIQLQLITDKKVFYKTKSKLITQYRKHHTSTQSRKYHTQTIENKNKTNLGRFLWVTTLIFRLIARVLFYIIIINNMFYMSPTNLSLAGPISFGEELTNALTEAQDAAQDAYHDAAELEAEYQNTAELIQDLSDITGQSIPELTHELINENSDLFDPDEIVETSTPNPQAPNNTLESNDEMETDMEIYINSPDSDVESNNGSDTENSSFVDDSILNSDWGSDSETDLTSISDDTDDSDMEMELDIIQEMDAEDSDVDITELFIPLIFFPNSKPTWNKILITISLIGLRILLSFLDVSSISELSLSDTTPIIDMNLAEYQAWFNNLDKPLPDLPDLIDLSIFPFFFLRNPILDKIIKDILRIVYQYLINLITSILVNKANTVLLSVGLFGFLKLHKKDKGKGKEVEYKPYKEYDNEYDSEYDNESLDESDSKSVNTIETLASYDKALDSDVEEALDRDFARKRLESTIKEVSRKSYITEFLTKAKITPTKELQAEMARVLLQIQQERDDSTISSASDLTDSTDTDFDITRYDYRNKGKGKASVRLSTVSTEIDLDSVQRDEIIEESLTSPTESVNKQRAWFTAEERLKLKKSLPNIPQDSVDDLLDEISKLNRFSGLSQEVISKNEKLFRNFLRAKNSPRPTIDTQLRTPRTEHFTDYDFRSELDESDTKSLRDTFDDCSTDAKSYKTNKSNTRLRGHKNNKPKW
jgi:hypothetical protein